ncbi:uncharacterized protein [Watersipora subatra]|uniref:uncharacterized protein isoform X2 n=1 Tax=Watersipora subatra TaxID=2589382 RepID=UPI00355C492B
MHCRKCVPAQSECIISGRIAEVYKGTPIQLVLKGRFSADYLNGIEAVAESVYDAKSGNLLANYTEVRTKIATYLIDHTNNTCTKGVGFPVTRLCTDTPGLKYIDPWKMGTQMTDTYFYNEPTVNRSLTLTMFRDSFTQAAAVIDQTFQGVPQQVSVLYGNETNGIHDTSIFILPPFCTV